MNLSDTFNHISVNITEGNEVYKMKRSWGKFYWISTDVTVTADTPDNKMSNIFTFCLGNCDPGETLFNINWGGMLEISGDLPESTFTFTYIASKGQKNHIYIEQVQTEGNNIHLELFFDGSLIHAFKLDSAIDHEGLVVYASRPNHLPFTEFGKLENLKWGIK